MVDHLVRIEENTEAQTASEENKATASSECAANFYVKVSKEASDLSGSEDKMGITAENTMWICEAQM